MPHPALAAQLRELRAAAGITQVELARRAGVTERSIGAYEAGKTIPSALQLPSLARALGVTVDELLRPLDTASR